MTSQAFAASPWGLNRANQKYLNEEYEAARQRYEALLKDGGDGDQVVFYNLGNTLYRLGDYARAETLFLKALNGEDTEIRKKALYNLGNTKYRQQSLEEAVALYNKVLEMDPDDAKAELNRDFVLKRLEGQPSQPSDSDQKQDQSGQQASDSQEKQPNQDKVRTEQQSGSEPSQDNQAPDDQSKDGEQPQDEAQPTEAQNSEAPPSEHNNEEQQNSQAPREGTQGMGEPSQDIASEDPESTQTDGAPTDQRDLSRSEAGQLLNALREDRQGAVRGIIKQELGKQLPPASSRDDW